jgi:hypothetical protein
MDTRREVMRMGQQIGFYAIEEDYISLLQFAQEIGLRAIPELVSTDADGDAEAVEKIQTIDFHIPEGQTFFYLLPDSFATVEAFYEQLPSEPWLAKLMPYNSPVIEFTPCSYEGNKVYDGRFFFGTERDDPRYPVVQKMYNRLVRYVRKWARAGQTRFYVGPHTAELARNNRIHLMHNLVELKVT